MAEDVQEQFALGREPTADAAEQRRPIRHVLEHFDRDHAVELSRRRERVHVGGAEVKIREFQQARRLLNITALAV